MSRQAVEELIDRWLNDPAFREAVRRDPEGTVRATGADLTDEECAALRPVDWSLPDEELRTRVDKWG